MSDKTGISWTDATWNPVRGCSRVSEGCRNCYAEKVAARFSGPGQPYEGFAQVIAPRDLLDRVGGRRNGWTRKVALVPNHLADPLRWKRPRRIFVNSMSDLFHESLPDVDIDRVLAVMLLAPHHTFQVLTKRAARMRAYFADPSLYDRVLRAAGEFRDDRPELNMIAIDNPSTCPKPWIWLGVSVENQAAADERIPELLATPAAVRFLSCEPLIGEVDLAGRNGGRDWLGDKHDDVDGEAGIDWVIAGCESGPGARTCSVEWLRSLRDQCAAADVAFFLKQAVESSIGICGDADNPNGDDPCGKPITAFVVGPGTASYHCGCTVDSGGEDGACVPLGFGAGSKRKARGVIELPYLDGVQHAAFPETP